MRQSGYRVTIRGFLPADRKSLEDTARVVGLLQKSVTDPEMRGELVAALIEFAMDVKSTSREMPVAAQTAAEPEPFS